MAGETTTTVIGFVDRRPRAALHPESGTAVANFTVSSTPRTFDK